MEQQLNNISSEIKPKRKRWITVVIFFIIVLAIGSLIATEGVQWWKDKQYWVKLGFASDKFPFRMLNEEELVRKGLWSGESEWYNSIPTRTTPEETYNKLIKALNDGNMDLASECFVQEKQEEWKKSLYDIKQKGYLREMLEDLPKELEDTYVLIDRELVQGIDAVNLNDEMEMSYHYSVLQDGTKWAQNISFIKNFNGDWLIDKLY